MSGSQRQDLVVFSDHTALTPELVNNNKHNTILVSYGNSTAPLWLILALIETQLIGMPLSLNGPHSSTTTIDRSVTKNSVILSSFQHNQAFFTNSLQKLKISSNQYKVVDFLTDFVLNIIGKSKDQIWQYLLASFPEDSKSTIIIEDPQLLLSLISDVNSDEIQQKFITPLSKKCGLLIIVSAIEPFDNLDVTNVNDPDTIQYNRFILGCFYKSLCVLSLKQLETGKASDVTGTLKITRGGQNDNLSKVHVVENEYLYFTHKDVTKLFYR